MSTSSSSGDMIFAAVDELRSLFVPSSVRDPLEECDRFTRASGQWTSIKARTELLAPGTSGFEIMHGVAPPLDFDEIPIQVKHCVRK